jgi:hypothetical protein
MPIPLQPNDAAVDGLARELVGFPNKVAWAAIQAWLAEHCPPGLWRETGAAVWAERRKLRMELRPRAHASDKCDM